MNLPASVMPDIREQLQPRQGADEPVPAAGAMSKPATPRIVIVGAGFGGLVAAKALRKLPAQVTVIDRRNYHLFQPLLYQVATAGLSPADIASPIRGILRDQANAEVLMARVSEVDRARREVVLDDVNRRVPFDYLIIAAGARHAYFGHDEWEAAAPGLNAQLATLLTAAIAQRHLGSNSVRSCADSDDAARLSLLR